MTASEQGYYILNGHIIYYMDKTSDKPIILDNRPNNECLSTTNWENCHAFVPLQHSNSYLFQFYEDKLYTIEYKLFGPQDFDSNNPIGKTGEHELVSRDPNGENRKVLLTFPHEDFRAAAIHGGYFYYIV